MTKRKPPDLLTIEQTKAAHRQDLPEPLGPTETHSDGSLAPMSETELYEAYGGSHGPQDVPSAPIKERE